MITASRFLVLLTAFVLAAALSSSAAAGGTEACCLPGDQCADLTPIECGDFGGNPAGPGTDCASGVCTPADGACCINDGCQLFTESQCAFQGGVYEGDGTTCDASTCIAACCFQTDPCLDLDPAGCAAAGGSRQALGVLCASGTCEAMVACCLTSPAGCADVTVGFCLASGGFPQGDGSECATVTCPPGPACCFPDGSCQDLTDTDCTTMGGTGQFGEICATLMCPQPPDEPVACCFSDNSCQDLTPSECGDIGGNAQGMGTNCMDAGACAPESGACCLAGGGCSDVPPAECGTMNGTFQGTDTACATADCSEVACCFADGSCEDLLPDTCTAMNGGSQGGGSACMGIVCMQITVACCFADGSCDDVTPQECNDIGGAPQDPDTDCASGICDLPDGACCLAGGSCMEMSQLDCIGMTGVFQGPGTMCGAMTCTLAACCFADASCQDLVPAVCSNSGGTPEPPGTSCAGVVCPEMPTACCFADNSCMDITPTQCGDLGGTTQAGMDCASGICIPPTGACCTDTECIEVSDAECTAQGGTYSGDGTLCAALLCGEVACCLTDGSCQDLREDQCTTAGGDPQAAGTSCAAFGCPLPPVACCFPDGSCQFIPPGMCGDQGGLAQPAGSMCGGTICDIPDGACCLTGCPAPGCACTVVSFQDCATLGGTFLGGGTDCSEDSDGDTTPDCEDGCPDDINKTSPGVCGCGEADEDLDDDTVTDCVDNCDLFNPGQEDCNANMIGDACDIANGPSLDCNNDTIPDECQPDCDDDGIPDDCEITGGSLDCNGNTLPDECEIAMGADDCDNDGNLDECDAVEPDSDNDDVIDDCDNCDLPNEDQFDCDLNGIGDVCELNATTDTNGNDVLDICENDCDGDGRFDQERIQLDGIPDCDMDGIPDEAPAEVDTDGDGTIDDCDGCPDNFDKTDPGECGCDTLDTDTDMDGTPDCIDACPDDPDKIEEGDCGCGNPDVDTDGDGVLDCDDGCPFNPNKLDPGECGCDTLETDTDDDGTPDCNDGCPGDDQKIDPGQCGCGMPETDTDGDTVADCVDNCTEPNADQLDCNANGIGDVCDIASGSSLDTDSNGVPDECEFCDLNEMEKLLADIPSQGDMLGDSVAFDGTVAVVGAPEATPGGSGSGSVTVYRLLGGTLVPDQTLIPDDGAPGDHFGNAVAVSDDVIVVGAFEDDDNGLRSGSAYVFRFDGADWQQEQKLTASDGAILDAFGAAVAVTEDLAIIGAPRDDDGGSSSGSVYVFRYDGATWNEQAKLRASDAEPIDNFGASVAVRRNATDDLAAIGAPRADTMVDDAGTVYVLRYDGALWNEEAILTASDGAEDDGLGVAVAVSGDAIVAGAPGHDTAGMDAGAAYVFRYDGVDWNEEARLESIGDATAAALGTSVAIRGDTAVAGAPGEGMTGGAYRYAYDGTDWTRVERFVSSSPDPDDAFGSAVGVSDVLAIAGAPGDDDLCIGDPTCDSGALYVFTFGTAVDCNGNGRPDQCDIDNGISLDANGDDIPDECQATASGIDPGETEVLVPGGGTADRLETPVAVITNESGPPGGQALLDVTASNLHPAAGGFGTLGTTTTFQTTIPDGQFFLTLSMPFEEADLGGAPPDATDLVFFNSATNAWELAVAANTQDSPGTNPPSPIGDRTVDLGPDPPLPLSAELGDYGVYWNTNTLNGFVWANIDHATDFAVGLPEDVETCPEDLNDNGMVDFPDILALIGLWGPCDDCPEDLDGDGEIGFFDILLVIAAWGPCPGTEPPPKG